MYVHMFSSGVKPERLRGPSLLLLFNFPSWIKVNRCWSGSMNRSAAFIFKHITALHRFHYLDQGPRWLSIVLVWRSLSWINNSLHRGSLFHLVTAASSRNWAEHSLLSFHFPSVSGDTFPEDSFGGKGRLLLRARCCSSPVFQSVGRWRQTQRCEGI